MCLGRTEARRTIFLGEIIDGWLKGEIHPLLWLSRTNISVAAGELTCANELRAACQDGSPILKSSANQGFPQGSVSSCTMGMAKTELPVHSHACWLRVILPPSSVPHPRLPAALCTPRGSSFECGQSEVKSLPQIAADISVILVLHEKPAGCLICTAPRNSDPSCMLCSPPLQKGPYMHRNFYCIYFPCVLFIYPHYFVHSMEKQIGSFK